MINDLKVPNVPIWKYVDDMSIAEKEPKGALSNAQAAVTSVQTTWNFILVNAKNLLLILVRTSKFLIRLWLMESVFRLCPKQIY